MTKPDLQRAKEIQGRDFDMLITHLSSAFGTDYCRRIDADYKKLDNQIYLRLK